MKIELHTKHLPFPPPPPGCTIGGGTIIESNNLSSLTLTVSSDKQTINNLESQLKQLLSTMLNEEK